MHTVTVTFSYSNIELLDYFVFNIESILNGDVISTVFLFIVPHFWSTELSIFSNLNFLNFDVSFTKVHAYLEFKIFACIYKLLTDSSFAIRMNSVSSSVQQVAEESNSGLLNKMCASDKRTTLA